MTQVSGRTGVQHTGYERRVLFSLHLLCVIWSLLKVASVTPVPSLCPSKTTALHIALIRLGRGQQRTDGIETTRQRTLEQDQE
jgi:hypothetical protein